jgi:hypothetical protein
VKFKQPTHALVLKPRDLKLSAFTCAVLALGALAAAPAAAIEINTGNPDAVMRWDNTVRYNYGVRMKDRDPSLIGNPGSDDGDRNFAKGQPVTNRLDLLSELDLVVNKRYGFRVSATAWADAAYNSLATDANKPAFYNGTGGVNSLSDYTSRFAKGPSGEFLDAFVFGNFDAGDVPVSARLGRHTAYWGEGLLLGGAIHGVSYGQYALDIWKANATPGAEAKELYRPRNGVTVQFQPTTDLTIVGQTFFDWEAARLPESGTYLSGADALLTGGQRYFVPTLGAYIPQGYAVTPKKTGDWGLSARWSPEWVDGTLGFYARRTADIAQQSWATNLGSGPQYHYSFASDIDILGVSLSKNVNGISVGAEASVRNNMPLVSQPVLSLNPAIAAKLKALADNGDVPGARGNTAHMVLNMVGILPKNPAFDIASVAAELTWNRVLSVTSDPFNAYKGSAAYTAGNTLGAANIDAVTRDATSLGVSFTPTWLSAMSDVDISLPTSYSVGLSGNSGVASGGNERSGSWSIGVAADIKSKYNLAVRYIAAFGPKTTVPAGPFAGAAAVTSGSTAAISDRDMLVLTFKATF